MPKPEQTRGKSGRVTPKGTKSTPPRATPPSSGRYTPPIPREQKVSPKWVPALMFTLLILGMLTIVTNYLNLLPGKDPSNVYLLLGLAFITGGFITATKYH
jgi:Cell division protein CrgA